MIRYAIGTGVLQIDDLVYHGYSGAFGATCNNPAATHLSNLGPIPVGAWRIGTPVEHTKLGPLAIPLEPIGTTQTFGRSGFYVHGDNIERPGHASDGCIIQSHTARVELSKYIGHALEVVP